VENIGDVEAINISEVGGTPWNKPLKSGDRIYLRLGVTLKKQTSDKHSPQDLINDMDKSDYVIEHQDTVLYFQKSKDKVYVAKFVYRIGKKNAQLIRYETK